MKEKFLSIKDWDKSDRPREKMLQLGPSALSNAELIAILINSGNTQETAVELAKKILHSVNNNLNSLGKLTIKDLTSQFKGIGIAKATVITAALELGRRRKNSTPEKRKQIKSSADLYELFAPIVEDLNHEELWIALSNQGGYIIDKIQISRGGINSTVADIRLILKQAIIQLASGIFLCHNHPSGNIQPSLIDNKLTSNLYTSANQMGIKLLDHIIITNGNYYSYADEGAL